MTQNSKLRGTDSRRRMRTPSSSMTIPAFSFVPSVSLPRDSGEFGSGVSDDRAGSSDGAAGSGATEDGLRPSDLGAGSFAIDSKMLQIPTATSKEWFDHNLAAVLGALVLARISPVSSVLAWRLRNWPDSDAESYRHARPYGLRGREDRARGNRVVV